MHCIYLNRSERLSKPNCVSGCVISTKCHYYAQDKILRKMHIALGAVTSASFWQPDGIVNLLSEKNALSQCTSMCYIWWRYVKAFVSYVWSSIRTHKQTYTHTNPQTNIPAKMQILACNWKQAQMKSLPSTFLSNHAIIPVPEGLK